MAVQLVPYTQDEQKWLQHYLAQARKQLHNPELTKQFKEKSIVRPSIVLPTMQLAEQAKSQAKREKGQSEIFAPVKITPEFENESSSTHSTKQTSHKRKASPTKDKKPKKSKKQRKKDIFD